jgi:hypothetical protein
MSLITRQELERSERGSYFVPTSVLVRMYYEELKAAEQLLNKLVNDNPDYEFRTEELFDGTGIRISWRKHDPEAFPR